MGHHPEHHGGADREYEQLDDVFVERRWLDTYAEAGEGRVMNSITEKQAKVIEDMHNKLRRQEGSANMETLHYNPKLAALAQTWSQRCVFEHGQPPFSESNVGYQHLGQNIFAHTDPKFDVDMAVQAWYDEKKDYHYDSVSCAGGKVCGHYTAVTWAKTTEVGCGMTFCPSISGLTKAHFIVCNYAPAGNFYGREAIPEGTGLHKVQQRIVLLQRRPLQHQGMYVTRIQLPVQGCVQALLQEDEQLPV
jgi:hypothetical protein